MARKTFIALAAAFGLGLAPVASAVAAPFAWPTVPSVGALPVVPAASTKLLRNIDPGGLKALDIKPVKPRVPDAPRIKLPDAPRVKAPDAPKLPTTRPRSGALGAAGAPPPLRPATGGFVKGVVPSTARSLDPGAVVIGSREVRKAKRFAALRAKLPPLTAKNVAIGSGIAAFVALQFVPQIVVSNIDFTDDTEADAANEQ